MSEPEPQMSDAPQSEIVTFKICEQAFCFDIQHVREIRGWVETTTLPHAPHYVLGMMNLRGNVLPVVDLSDRLGLGETEPSARHVIIIASIKGKNVGFLVDAVSDIVTVTADDLQPPPEVSSARTIAFLEGVYFVQDTIVRKVNLLHILDTEESDAA